MYTLDDGTRVIDGRFWYYPDYMTTNCLQILADTGQVTFQLAQQETPPGLTPAELDAFFQGFIEAMLWSTPGDVEAMEEDLLNYDLAENTRLALRALCENWTRQQETLLREYVERRQPDTCAGPIDTFAYAGHDFWLTSAGHGVGFWDRGLGDLGDQLTAACKPLEYRMEAYVGDDNLVYVTGMERGQPLSMGAGS
jgi:hypothetical protein